MSSSGSSAMDGIDGLLLVPPDRTQILGRAAWKPRYVVVARSRLVLNRPRQGSSTFTQGVMSVRTNSVNSKASSGSTASDDYYLFIYKSKEDTEPIQQWPIGYVTDCKVQQVTNRKQSPVLPTLIVTITDKERRRRSGRAAGFISANKESGTTTLWFRTPPDDLHPSLHDWARFILSRKSSNTAASPISPVLSTPQSSQSRDNSEQGYRPGSGSRFLQHKTSTATHATGPRDRPATFSSDSPSLRSKRSDISSPSSNQQSMLKSPFGTADQHYTTIVPLPLTASPSDLRGEFIEGWTSAQGRSSILGSPARSGRDSTGFQSTQFSIYDAASPPAPGETILDRAFQLGQIPGAETYIPGQENLSSIARFDALMREADEKRKKAQSVIHKEQPALRSAFDDDDSTEEDGENDADEESRRNIREDSSSESDEESHENYNGAPLMSPGAQRALAYIAGRHATPAEGSSHRPSLSRTHLSYHAGPTPVSPGNYPPPSRPQTAHAKSRPSANRSDIAPRVASAAATSLDLPSSAAGAVSGAGYKPSSNKASMASQSHPMVVADKRHSGSSNKRLSFTEFTKRLSSTSSSLLIVQTNASTGSSRGSCEIDSHSPSASKPNLTARGSNSGTASAVGQPISTPNARSSDGDGRCRWRGKVGIVGSESNII